MAFVTLGLATISFLLMLLLAAPGFDNSMPTREPMLEPVVC